MSSQAARTRRAKPIDEEQLPEIKLIKNRFLLNNRMKIIISVCSFYNRVGHRYTRVFVIIGYPFVQALGISLGTLSHTIFENIVLLRCPLCSKLTQ